MPLWTGQPSAYPTVQKTGAAAAELSSEFGVHPTTISTWKQELMKRASELFARGNKASRVDDAQKVIDDLHRKIGQLQVERDFPGGQPVSRLLRGGR